jgi:hypothetical protein
MNAIQAGAPARTAPGAMNAQAAITSTKTRPVSAYKAATGFHCRLVNLREARSAPIMLRRSSTTARTFA